MTRTFYPGPLAAFLRRRRLCRLLLLPDDGLKIMASGEKADISS